MSADSAKRRMRRNKSLIASYLFAIVGVNLAVLCVHVLCRWSVLSFVNVLTLSVEAATFAVLKKISSPKVLQLHKKAEIQYEGADLSSRGLVHVLVDCIYISLGIKLFGMFFRRAWMVFILVPISGYYELFMRSESKVGRGGRAGAR